MEVTLVYSSDSEKAIASVIQLLATLSAGSLGNSSQLSRKTSENFEDRKFVTKSTAAEILDISVRQIERYIEHGKLRKYSRGPRRVVLLMSEVQSLVE